MGAPEKTPWFTEEEVNYYAQFLTGDSEDRDHNFRTLLSTVGEVLGETDLDRLLRKLVAHAIQTTGSERGILLMAEDEELTVRVALDAEGNDLGEDPPMSHSVPNRVVADGTPVTERVTTDHEVLDFSHSATNLRLRQVMCAALRARGNAIGAIYVDSTMSSDPTTRSDLMLFHAQAGLMGMAIENHRLFREAMDAREMRRQLKVARDIQLRLLPESPVSFDGLDISGLADISAQVGGDYYDYLPLDSERIAFGIGDVSGHGIAPALVMSDVRAHLRSLLQTQGALGGVYGILNEALCQDLTEGMFVALFVAIYYPKRKVLEFQNAGHAPPLLYRPEADHFDSILPNAPALGLFDGFSAGPCPTFEVQAGDCLVCYTDGVVDRPDDDGGHYGMERLKQAVRDSVHAGADPTEVARAIQADAGAFAGQRPLRDDFSLLIARF